MNIALIFFYILSFFGLLINGFLHGNKKPKIQCYYNLPNDVVRTIIELLFIWWILGWKII